MSSFNCEHCNTPILDSDHGYITECEHYPFEIGFRTMKLCPICGNKRCPKATDPKLECTNSNEPRQKGSAYE